MMEIGLSMTIAPTALKRDRSRRGDHASTVPA
jgi:hypothetical protein